MSHRSAMMRYVGWWTRCASLAVAVGICLAILLWSPAETVVVWCAASLSIGVLLMVLAPAAGPDSPAPAFRWSRLGCRSVAAGAAVVALGAGVAAVPPLAWPLAAVVVLSSPPVVDRVLRWRAQPPATARPAPSVAGGSGERPTVPGPGRASGGPGAPTAAAPHVDDLPVPEREPLSEAQVRELGDLDLCQLWRRSFVSLESATSASHRMQLVGERQLLLDELERRSPRALAAWLASGARAASGPERFLGERPDARDGRPDAA